MEAKGGEPAAAPAPVSADRIDDEGDHGAVHAVGLEVRALCHGAGDDRRSRCAEHGLEDHIAPQRHRLRNDTCFCGVGAADEQIRDSDESAESSVKHDREADEPEARGTDAEVHHVLHQDVAGVLCSCEARLAERKTRLHEVDECRTDQHPYDGSNADFHNLFSSSSLRVVAACLPGQEDKKEAARTPHPHSLSAVTHHDRLRNPHRSLTSGGIS